MNNLADSATEWNKYWSVKNKPAPMLFDIIAALYRKHFIRPLLNHFIRKNFQKSQIVLHAGCGSGQVDRNIREYLSITALDISEKALELYRNENGKNALVIKGDLLRMQLENESFDGIYNLGVMEHFTEPEINRIFNEFNRVLKSGGKLVIFWPPVFGLSVIILDSIHFILNRILRQNILLHPIEITRVRSKKHVVGLFEKAGFRVTGYYFGILDLFVQTVITAEKIR